MVEQDSLLRERRLREMVGDWTMFLEIADEEQNLMIQKRTKTGRPMGGEQFIADLETITGRELMLKTAGRPRNEN